jgi:hypothetical protein
MFNWPTNLDVQEESILGQHNLRGDNSVPEVIEETTSNDKPKSKMI